MQVGALVCVAADWGHGNHDDDRRDSHDGNHPWQMDGRHDERSGPGHDWWDKIKQAQQGNKGATQGTNQTLPSMGVLLEHFPTLSLGGVGSWRVVLFMYP